MYLEFGASTYICFGSERQSRQSEFQGARARGRAVMVGPAVARELGDEMLVACVLC